MRIGYSFWGFLGPGITDTPDGGRSHRRPLIDGLITAGHEVVFLQRNRDQHEADHDLRRLYAWDDGLPAIDALFLEWHWPVAGRSTTPCGSPGHACDLYRQDELVEYYTVCRQVPTIVWDKDLQLEPGSPLRSAPNVTVCEAGLRSAPGARACSSPSPTAHWTRPTPSPWQCCPGPSRSPMPGTSTTGTRRSPSSSRLPPVGTSTGWPGNGPSLMTGRT